MQRTSGRDDRALAPAVGRRGFLQLSAASAASLWLAGRGAPLLAAEPADLVPPVEQRVRRMLDEAPLAMQFQGRTADDCRRWQAEFGAKLNALLGPYQPPDKWDCVLERRVELPDHVREERVLTAAGLAPVPVHLLFPKGAKKRQAGMVAVHGHWPFAHDGVAGIDDTPERRAEIERFHDDYGLKLVQRGYVVACPCLTPFGRRLGEAKDTKRMDPCTAVALRLGFFGKLLMAENLRDILWARELLARQDAVDPERIGCGGLSYGGRMTMLATAVEPRIRAAVICGALNCFQERCETGAAGCQWIPGLLQYGDVPEIGGLIAPRPCVWEIGSTDRLLPADWAEKAIQRLKRPYAALGAAEQLHFDHFEGGHIWHGEVAYSVLEKALGPAAG